MMRMCSEDDDDCYEEEEEEGEYFRSRAGPQELRLTYYWLTNDSLLTHYWLTIDLLLTH